MGKPRGRNLEKKQMDEEFHPELEVYDEATESFKEGVNPQMFFGVLDREELEYFKQAEATLGLDTFESEEEKAQFVTNVIQEATGKELKLVTSQICSKLMERLILNCDDLELKKIFQAFNGNFYNISCHKYASHVVETLLVRSASLVEKELLTPHFDEAGNDDEVFAPIETLFLYMLNEMKPHLKSMLNHQYASHVLRLVILIISSKTLPSTTQNNSTLRSKKSKVARKMINLKDNEDFNKVYQTPESFKVELKSLLTGLYEELSGGAKSKSEISPTAITKFRELCVDKVASPVIQLIIQVEGIFDRDRSFWRLAFNTNDEKDSKEESFMEYLLSDAVGSHFLENVIGFAKPRFIERLYRIYIKDKVVKLAKRDTTGSFVIQALLKNMKDREVKEILDFIIPDLSMLLNSNMDFGTTIINACTKQNNYKREEVIDQLVKKYYPEKSEDKNILESCLLLASSTLGNTRDDWPTAEERRRSLFLEELIDFDDKFLNITIDSMLALPESRLLQMCYHGVFSHVVEHVLQVQRVETIKRKLLLNVLVNDVVKMSCNAYGSHIVDKLWEFSAKLTLYKERIAAALVENTEMVKNSVYGRQVWKNWQLEKYNRKRWEWKKIIKENDMEIFPNSTVLQPKPAQEHDQKRKMEQKPAEKRARK
ncbi:RNA-binding RNA processing protein NOP9 [Nakaseomyces bracarensis]|uniref:RNA-binding RNA processing protein NOP9 n=1 Tax=Nakaseomyces bracarensis TaxID=273131 RepID=UPI0038723C55